MTIDDQVFSDICGLLNKNEINYWICHGTLLGIIREGRLLPWDHDIDFAVWDNETDKEHLVSLFESKGYRQESIFGDMDCLHFIGGTKKIDVSFYKVNDEVASVKWAIIRDDILNRLLVFVASRLDKKNEDEGNKKGFSKPFIRKLFLRVLDGFSTLLRIYLPIKLKNKIIQLAFRKMRKTGYCYPVSMLKITKMEYKGLFIPVPIDSEGCLYETYGPGWRIPNKEYVWYQEANNLVDF